MSEGRSLLTKRNRLGKTARLEQQLLDQHGKLQAQEEQIKDLRRRVDQINRLIGQFVDGVRKVNLSGKIADRFRDVVLLYTGICASVYTLYT